MNIALVDIGGTTIKSALWSENRLENFTEVPTDNNADGKAIMKQVVKLLEKNKDFQRIGIATAGQIDSKNGIVKYANPNILNYTGTNIREILERQFKVNVAVENDVNAAAIGEMQSGAGKGESDCICLTYGTGIGGAIFLGGEIYRGSAFSAGEFGGIVTHGSRRTVNDIMSGTYERYASTTALVNEAIKYDKGLDTGRKIMEEINNPDVKKIVDRWTDEIVIGLVSLVHIFNPSLIIMGGGIMEQKSLVKRVKEKLVTRTMESFEVRLVPAKLGNTAGMMGALHLAKKL